jgi:hypothetical protein
MFTVHQWLELAAIVIIPFIVAHIVTKGVCAYEDRRTARQSRELNARLEEISRMPE